MGRILIFLIAVVLYMSGITLIEMDTSTTMLHILADVGGVLCIVTGSKVQSQVDSIYE